MNKYKEYIQQLLSSAGITLNGEKPWDLRIHEEKLYEYVLGDPELLLGEAYMAGWWDCRSVDQFFYQLLRSQAVDIIIKNCNVLTNFFGLYYTKVKDFIMNPQSLSRSLQVARKHYDLGNELFHMMLDKEMNYSCAYWKNAHSLEEAQNEKLDLICQKLQLTPGMTVLDIGCGWGSFARFAAKHYGAQVTGVTISEQQYALAKDWCRGLPIEIRLQDYRNIEEQYDRVCSIGMYEHVGYQNYITFMQKAASCLKEEGLFLLHTIGSNQSMTRCNSWVDKYIFPNSMLPSIKQIAEASEGLFIMEDWHNFGEQYDQTLMSWHKRFNQGWKDLTSKFPQYDDRFFRMWNFYLLSCAGAFRSRNLQLWQIVFSKQGVLNGYPAVR